MEFNTEYLNQNYHEIRETTISDGKPVPYLIEMNTDIAVLYTNKKPVKISASAKDKIGEAYLQRRQKEQEIWRKSENKTQRKELLDKYLEDEVKQFIKDYPKFKEVLE